MLGMMYDLRAQFQTLVVLPLASLKEATMAGGGEVEDSEEEEICTY